MTCEKCIHSCVCETYVTYGGEWRAEKCDDFKPKSRFVELPCEVGQTVYFIKTHFGKPDSIVSLVVYQIEIDRDGIWVRADDGPFHLVRRHTDYYYSREEAEKALAERSK